MSVAEGIGNVIAWVLAKSIVVFIFGCCVVFGNYLSRKWLPQEPCKCECKKE